MPYEFKKDELIAKDTGKTYHTDNPHKLAKLHEYFSQKGEKMTDKEKKNDKESMEEDKKEERKKIEENPAVEEADNKQKETDKDVKEDWEAKYNSLQKEHLALQDKLKKEERTKHRDETFNKYGLKEENRRLLSRYMDNMDDVSPELDLLSKEFPHLFEDKDTTINKSLDVKDYKKKEDTKEIDRTKLGMIG